MKIPVLALLSILIAACSQTQQLSHRQLFVLRFENLTGDPALDWMGRGAARQIAARIEGAAVADSPSPASERERAIVGGATRILHGYISKSGDRLRLRADLEDAASGKFAQWGESSGLRSAGLAPLADTVARQLDPEARPGGTRSETALEAYVSALDAPDPAAAMEPASRAVAADPDFGAAYIMLIELSEARRDRAGAERFLALARARGQALPLIDRARLDVFAAQIAGNADALAKALAALSRLTPGDARLLRTLADTELQAKRYPTAIGYYHKALEAQPGDAALLNTLGYAQAYAGNLEEAVKALREYERLHPGDANAFDSLGEVNFYLGHFSEAESLYRREYAKDPTFLNGASLIKAATAHLMTGDLSGAEAVFAEYEKTARRAANDPLIDFTRAEWDRLRGKRSEAIRNLEKLAGSTPNRDLAALAHSSLTVWLLEAGDRERARQHAAQAVAAAGPTTAGMAAACRFVAGPAGGSFPNPLVSAYAFLLAGNFGAALPLLRDMNVRTPPNVSDPTPALLAWALVETGHIDEADTYLRMTPVPPSTGPAPFEALIFPRLFHLRAVVAEKKGSKAAAEANDRLYQALSAGRS